MVHDLHIVPTLGHLDVEAISKISDWTLVAKGFWVGGGGGIFFFCDPLNSCPPCCSEEPECLGPETPYWVYRD
jgi:hypothetical protein